MTSEATAPGGSGHNRAPATAVFLVGLILVVGGVLVWRVSEAAFGYGWFAYSPSSGDASPQSVFTCLLSWTASQAIAGLCVVLGLSLGAAAVGYLAGGSAGRQTRTSATVAVVGLVLAIVGYIGVHLMRVPARVLVVAGDDQHDLALMRYPIALWSWSAPQLTAAGLCVLGLALLVGASAFRAAARPTD